MDSSSRQQGDKCSTSKKNQDNGLSKAFLTTKKSQQAEVPDAELHQASIRSTGQEPRNLSPGAREDEFDPSSTIEERKKQREEKKEYMLKNLADYVEYI